MSPKEHREVIVIKVWKSGDFCTREQAMSGLRCTEGASGVAAVLSGDGQGATVIPRL